MKKIAEFDLEKHKDLVVEVNDFYGDEIKENNYDS